MCVCGFIMLCRAKTKKETKDKNCRMHNTWFAVIIYDSMTFISEIEAQTDMYVECESEYKIGGFHIKQ